jgi:outer membrane protein OmpA-like peptidoglycan-associated protein
MKTVSYLSVAALLVLGACSHYSDELASLEGKVSKPAPAVVALSTEPQNIAPAAGNAPSTQTLNATLASEYYNMARFENEKAYDYKAAKQFTQKARMAAEGKLVVPSKVSAFDVPEEKVGELNEARAQLIGALKTQNTPENQTALGIAQCRYECWLERSEEAADEAHYSSCKNEFEAAMAQLVVPASGAPAATTAYEIGFSANSAVLDEASKKTIEYLANFLNAPSNLSYNANVTGFAAPAQGEYMQNLANQRVVTVRDALMRSGVDVARLNPLISVDPAAATPEKVQVLLVPTEAHSNAQTKTEFVPVPRKEVPAGQ